MLTFVIVLVLLAALGILGAVVKGLLWLTFIASLVFVVALAYGWSKFRTVATS
ncbi:MAG: hypothetical protein R2710_06285 [Acidimicrobiales bacterium]